MSDKHGGHGKVICTECGDIIAQCRCMEHVSNVRYGVCADCSGAERRRVRQDACPNCGAGWYAFTEAAASNGHTYTRYCNWCGRVESLRYPSSPIGDGEGFQWCEVYAGKLIQPSPPPAPTPKCDICGLHEAVTGVGRYGVCSEHCAVEASRREDRR